MLRTSHETLALIQAQWIFPYQKSMLVQTITLTHLGLYAYTCAIKYCQKKNHIPVPRSNKNQTTSQFVALCECHETFALIYAHAMLGTIQVLRHDDFDLFLTHPPTLSADIIISYKVHIF